MSKRNLKFLFCAFLLFDVIFYVSILSAQQTDQLDEYVQAYVDLDKFSGSILVAKEGKIILNKGYGMANKEWGIPNAPNTKYRLGSITKQFTALMILQLAEEGKLALDDPIRKHLSAYREDTGDKITINHLLHHTSGIPSYTEHEDYDYDFMRNHWDVENFMLKHCMGDLKFEPGSQFEYNNSGYYLLGVLIETLTGQTYQQALFDRILKKVVMENTGYDDAEEIQYRRAAGYALKEGKIINSPFIDMSIPYAAGAIYSSTGDLYRWHQALNTDKLIGNKFKEKISEVSLSSYGAGWIISKTDERETWFHGGGVNGFSTYISRVPKDDICIIGLSNYSHANVGRICSELGRMLDGAEVSLPTAQAVITIDPTELTAFVGKYQLTPNHIFTITSSDGKLYSQLTGQGNHEIFPSSSDTFFYKVVEASLTFVKNDKGEVTQLILHQNGDHPASKIE